jgi:guanylate kinase
VLAGPSGVGKSTLVRALLARRPELFWSVSATDRAPRPGEVDGVDYRFLTHDEFCRLRDDGGFLEWFEVYGDLKGTPRAPVEEHLAAGDDVLIEVDVQGALAIREALPAARLVFIKPPSHEIQRERLRARDPEADPADLERRLAAATTEEAEEDVFDAVVVNDDLDEAADQLVAILDSAR